MSALRDEIRAILREELAALRSESTLTTETVTIRSSADLNRFAQELIRRAAEPGFAGQVSSGQINFELAEVPVPGVATAMQALVTSSVQPVAVMLEKALVTERDIIELGTQTKHVRLPKKSRLTPLAKDEARRIGIRIERVET